MSQRRFTINFSTYGETYLLKYLKNLRKGEVLAYIGKNQNLKDLKDSEPSIRKEAGLFCGSFLRKGEVFAYLGRSQNLKDLKDLNQFYH